MEQHEIDTLRNLMEYEAARSAPPEGFPALPDLPGGRYTDPRFFELEKQHIWRKSWLLASHIDEVPEPGCFRLWENAGQPVLIVHADSGAINAFYNTCSHRGAPIVTQEFGQRPRLVCKYHGWTYSHDGELLAIRDPEDFRGLDFSCRGLKPIRCERFGNLIFVNFDDGAPTLLDWLGRVADEWEEFQFDKCRLAARHSFDLDCNWKIAMEANTEVYHVRSIHPKTVYPILDDRRNVNTLYPNGHGRMVAPAPKGIDDPRAIRMPEGTEIETVGEIGRTCTQSYGVFPNWVSPLSQRALPPLLFWPNGIDKCRLETWTMAPDWGNDPKPDMWTVNDGECLTQVLLEDTEFGVWIQKSVESYGFKGVPLSYQEARIYHWNQHADRMIGIDNIPLELRVEQVIGDEWVYPNDPRLDQMAETWSAHELRAAVK
ncbi:MAG: aromatic ring-hydroxylating dioxygenase subunit alpha [Gammaproteobacteria bacterium]|nr:aromatic ring-hydroxylating dioxygenase subunit alpha [Gammaproteobacteria bacterium]